MAKTFDRPADDLGNCIALEHVNTTVPDQRPATLFYISGLGLTRDPYIQTGLGNMWVNVGRSQFHLPAKEAQVIRGHTALVLPDREALLSRLSEVKPKLADTKFNFVEREAYVETTSPWGNVIRCYEPDAERFGRVVLGMPYVELNVPVGVAAPICAFYRTAFKTEASVQEDAQGKFARVTVGAKQYLQFRETDKPIPEYDGHHIQIYVADFSGPHKWLLGKELITEESDQHQYRFKDLIDPESGKRLFTLEHEVRSLKHPLYGRPFVNRNPAQTNRDYVPGYDAAAWAMPLQ